MSAHRLSRNGARDELEGEGRRQEQCAFFSPTKDTRRMCSLSGCIYPVVAYGWPWSERSSGGCYGNPAAEKVRRFLISGFSVAIASPEHRLVGVVVSARRLGWHLFRFSAQILTFSWPEPLRYKSCGKCFCLINPPEWTLEVDSRDDLQLVVA